MFSVSVHHNDGGILIYLKGEDIPERNVKNAPICDIR